MSRYTKINSKMVQVPVGQGVDVLSRRGAMLAYTGDVRFAPMATAGQSLGGFVGRVAKGEHVPMMLAQGHGDVLYGHQGLDVTVVDLQGDQLMVEADKLLCYDGSLQAGTMFLGQGGGGFKSLVQGQMTGQGLFTTSLQGTGSVVILSHGPVFELAVTPQSQIYVDPQAYVAHRGQINPMLESNLGWRDAVGRGSGEAFQLKMHGQGVVYAQASEVVL